MDGRRLCLQSKFFDSIPSTATAHAGLWIDKFLPHQEKGAGQIKADHFAQAVRQVDPLYKPFYDRWVKALAESNIQTRQAKVLGRLAIGLGGESVLETSISLHRTYGVPYIPGSALKGLAASYARKRLEGWTAEHTKILFGDPDVAGYVTFYDALYIPGTAKYGKRINTPLALDVMTVHHPEYYRGEDVPPADWDSPTPISFLSTTGSYLIALHGPDEWVEAAFEILARALREEGIGAKTSSGYGRVLLEGTSEEQQTIVKETYALARKHLLGEKPPPGRLRGTIASVKGSYGFINPAGGGKQEFVHASQIRSKRPLKEGQVVEYNLGVHKGKQQAQDVEILREPDE